MLGGCAATGADRTQYDKFSPPAVVQQPINEPDLISLITAGKTSFPLTADQNPQEFSKALDTAIKDFYAGPGTDDAKALQRNRIQDRLILASNDACEQFKNVMKRHQAGRNFQFGTATVLLGAGGAVATVASTAKALSALAGASAGIRAEYNRDYFADVEAHVITKALNSRRREILAGILDGQKKPLTGTVDATSGPAKAVAGYSLESALADVITFHGACSLVGGLEYAEGAVSKVSADNSFIGLDSVKGAQKSISEMRTLQTSTQDAPKK
jgi:hypothetical protein